MTRLLRVASFLDPVRYADGLRLLEGLAAARAAGAVPDTVLVLEHHPVYTLGKRGLPSHLRGVDAASHATPEAARAAFAARTGADVATSPRGGEATWHGPGQAVIYPVLGLRGLGLGARAYVEALEGAMVGAAARWGVAAVGGSSGGGGATGSGRGAGVWVGPRKLGAVGVRITRGVTSHGAAINACPDLAAFDSIIPCGQDRGPGPEDRPVTSLDEELRRGAFACSAGADTGPLVSAGEAGAAVVAALVERCGVWEGVECVEAGAVWAEARGWGGGRVAG